MNNRFEVTLTKISEVRGPESFNSLMYVRALYEKFDTADRRTSSELAWKRERLPHWQQTPVEPFKPSSLVERPCPSMVEHTFANGERVGRCLGTHRMPDVRV